MNGIYDFENHRTPYLDTEMLMERKAKKTKRLLLMLSTIVMIMMIILMLRLTMLVKSFGDTAMAIMFFVCFIFATMGIILVERAVKKKGEGLCRQ